jgi:hypothetical protein
MHPTARASDGVNYPDLVLSFRCLVFRWPLLYIWRLIAYSKLIQYLFDTYSKIRGFAAAPISRQDEHSQPGAKPARHYTRAFCLLARQ